MAERKYLEPVAAHDDTEDIGNDDLMALAAALTKKQRDFVHELEVDGVAYQAAIRAGYSEASAYVQASKLLKNPKVLQYRKARMMTAYNAIGLTPEKIALGLLEVFNRCMQKVPVMEWDYKAKKWVESGEWRFNSHGATKALEMLGDSIGMFERRGGGPLSTEGVEEYLKRIGGGGKDGF